MSPWIIFFLREAAAGLPRGSWRQFAEAEAQEMLRGEEGKAVRETLVLVQPVALSKTHIPSGPQFPSVRDGRASTWAHTV